MVMLLVVGVSCSLDDREVLGLDVRRLMAATAWAEKTSFLATRPSSDCSQGPEYSEYPSYVAMSTASPGPSVL